MSDTARITISRQDGVRVAYLSSMAPEVREGAPVVVLDCYLRDWERDSLQKVEALVYEVPAQAFRPALFSITAEMPADTRRP